MKLSHCCWRSLERKVHELGQGTIATSCPWSETRGRVWLPKSMRSIYSLFSLWIYEYLHNFLLLGLENILIGDKLTWPKVVYIAYEDFHKLLILIIKLLLEINHLAQQRIFFVLFKTSKYWESKTVQKKGIIASIGSTFIEGNFRYWIKTKFPTVRYISDLIK